MVVAAATALAGLVAVPVAAQSDAVPGVTPKEIRVGGVAGITNAIGRPYKDGYVGAQAYFDEVNRKGGVHGRKFKLVGNIDDQSRASKNLLAARSMVEEKKVFAIVPMITSSFASAKYLAEQGTPTFGWNINAEWSEGPNLFGEKGSWLCFGSGCITMAPNYVALREGAKAVGLLAYGSSPQSAECSKGQENTFNKYGPRVGFVDRSLSFGFSANDISAAVQAVKDEGVDFIAACTDVNGEANFQKALSQAGVTDMAWYAPEGYDPQVLEDLAEVFEQGKFTFVTDFVPFEAADDSPGMRRFLKAMKKVDQQPNQLALVGWQSAMLLHEGIDRAGKDFTQESVVDTINQITDWNAEGTRATVDWTTDHGPTPPNSESCQVFLQVKDGKFVVVYGEPGKPFVCWPQNPWPATLDNPTFKAPGDA
jgi:ABC-type branched-subunit amino acid transport system substrate-binding protein